MGKKHEKKKKVATYNLNLDQINTIKEQAKNEALNEAFVLMLGLPTMVVHDNYGKLNRKQGREERFVDMVLDLFESFKEGYFTIEDVIQTLNEECGITLEFKEKI